MLALRALGLTAGAGIKFPSVPVGLKAIRPAGCAPRFINGHRATCCVSAEDLSSKASTVDTVITIHMLRHVCDVNQMRDAAPGKPNTSEDCAQALGWTLNGRLRRPLRRRRSP